MSSRRNYSLNHASKLLAAVALVAAVGLDRTARAQVTPAGSTPVNLEQARLAFDRANARLGTIRNQLDRGPGQLAPSAAGRDAALADYRRVLDELRPLVGQIAATASMQPSPQAQQLIARYGTWREEYASLTGVGNVGSFQITLGRRWTQLTQDANGWQDEQGELTWPEVVDKPDAPATRGLGLPKTAAFARGAMTYVREVPQMDGYAAFGDAPAIHDDLQQAVVARAKADDRLATAANKVIAAAGDDQLDQARRDCLDTFVERDVRGVLAGTPQLIDVLARGRSVVFAFDKKSLGEERATRSLRERLTQSADQRWIDVRAQYPHVAPLARPTLAQRGELVSIGPVQNALGTDFRSDDYDVAVEVGGYPVALRFDPAVKRQYRAVLDQLSMKSPGDDAAYEMIGVVAGSGKIEQARSISSPGLRATTQASADNPQAKIELGGASTRPTRLVPSDCLIVDVIALHVGPIAYGVDGPR